MTKLLIIFLVIWLVYRFIKRSVFIAVRQHTNPPRNNNVAPPVEESVKKFDANKIEEANYKDIEG